MSAYQTRKWLIVASLAMAALSFCFFTLAPVVGYPLRYSQAQSVLQIVLPVFLGYLGAASQFVFQRSPPPDDAVGTHPLTGLLVKGPMAVFSLMMVVLIVAFGYSNRMAAPPGDGMSAEQLSAGVTAAMGLLAVTTNVIVAYLFSVEKKPRGKR
jgi:hypothetical protein